MKTFKLVIAGGGSTYTPGIVKSLLVQKDRFKLNELVLYDNNAKRQEDVGVIVRHVVEMFDPDVKLTLTTDPETAMTDADFIFAQMRVGLYAMREQVKIRRSRPGNLRPRRSCLRPAYHLPYGRTD